MQIAYPEKFTYMENPDDSHIDIITKSTWGVARNLYESLNMSCNVIQVDNYGWLRNGSFDGVMGLFQRHKIDVLAHGTIMRTDRMPFVDFTGEIFAVSTPFIFRQPPLSAIANIYALPLSACVWACLLITIIVIVAIMCTQKLHPTPTYRLMTADIVTFVWGAVCQQSTILVITTMSGRVIVLTTFLAMLAIFTSYSATIVALLQSPSHSIQTIEDLIKSPLKMGIQEAGYNRYYYVEENQTVLNQVYRKRIQPLGPNGWIYDTVKGADDVRTKLFALQVESSTAYKIVARTFKESEKCSLSEIHLLRLPMLTVTVVKHSPFKEMFKCRLRWQRESGLIAREKRRWLPNKPICEGGIQEVRTVGIQEIKPALYLLLFGFVASFAILLIECAWNKLSMRLSRKGFPTRKSEKC